LTNAEWAVLEPFYPAPSVVGRPRKWPMRRIVEAILDLLRWSAVADAAVVLPAGFDGAALVTRDATTACGGTSTITC
jgi:transposase